MDEQAIYEALGLDPNVGQDAQEKGTQNAAGEAAGQAESTQTEPAEDAAGQGENGRGGAEPAPAEGTEADEGSEAGTPVKESAQGREPKGQKDHEQAERRRKQELDQRIKEAEDRVRAEERRRSQEYMDQAIKEMNLRDTSTGNQINTYQEYQTWRENAEREKLKRNLKKGELTPDDLNKLIAQNPTVKEMQRRQREDDNRRRQEQQSEAQKAIDAQLQEINKLDPNVKTVADLTKLPNFPEFRALVSKGLNFVQAYRLTNWDKLMESAGNQMAAAAKQQAISNARSKDHLQGIKAQGTGSGDGIPADELAIVRQLLPDATDKEIEAFWKKNNNKKG